MAKDPALSVLHRRQLLGNVLLDDRCASPPGCRFGVGPVLTIPAPDENASVITVVQLECPDIWDVDRHK